MRNVLLGSLFHVLSRVGVMAVGLMSVVRGLLMIALLVMFSGLLVVLRGLAMMFSGLAMMLRRWMRCHVVSPYV